ncbi:sensor histidine kinase [Paenibacillus sp. NPDC056579]|uniref:cache domain-containing sensor histidine kinase n=1 Tax=Paenibacillus sp. NPDC056579 TaxID=3345871 RepID=UPI003694EFA8
MRRSFAKPFTSIRGKILLSFFLCIIVPVAFIIYNSYTSSQAVLREQIDRSQQESMRNLAANMDDLSERMMNASNLIVNDMELQNFLQASPEWTGNYASFQQYQNVQKKLMNIKGIIMDSNAVVAVVDFRGFVHSSSVDYGGRPAFNELVKEPWYGMTISKQGWPYWQLPYEGTLGGESPDVQKWFVLTRLIKSPLGEEGLGLALIAIPAESFFPGTASTDEGDKGNTLLLVSGESKVLDVQGDRALESYEPIIAEASGQEHGGSLSRLTVDGQDYFYSTVPIPRVGWKVIELVPQTELMGQLNRIKYQSFLWLFALFAVFTMVFVVLMLRFTGPIRGLLHSMNRLGQGDFNAQVHVRGEDEIAKLGVHFNRMTANLRGLIDKLSEEQKRKEAAKFQALQAQINPHFLFNTLNSIKWMAVLSGSQHVSQMITKLGKLLQFTMKNDGEIITLEEEFTYLQDYLDLQKIRFHDNVQIETHLPETLKRCGILKFTLQPIVENSIIHGNRTPLAICISASETNGDLVLIVKDNGKGMSEEKLNEVKAALQPEHARYNGIGIGNVHERLRMHYGEGYGVELQSNEAEGTAVTIRMPLVQPEDEEGAR